MGFTDAFTGTAGDTLDVYSANWSIIGGTEGQYVWQINASAQAISAATGGGTGATAYSCPDQSDSFCEAGATLGSLVSGRADCMICSNLVDKNTAVGWRLVGTGSVGLRISKLVSGTFTDLTAGTSPSLQGVAGDMYKTVHNGTTYQLWYNNGGGWTQSGSDQTVSNAEVSSTNTLSGLVNVTENLALPIDDFFANPLSAAGSHPIARALNGPYGSALGGII